MSDVAFSVSAGGVTVCGSPKEILSELAFAHYPVTVDAGEGERTFASFDGVREYLQTRFSAAPHDDVGDAAECSPARHA